MAPTSLTCNGLLGHRSLRTTQIYTRTTIAEIKATHASPSRPEQGGHAYKPAIGRRGNRCFTERPAMKLDELLHRFQGDLQIRNYSARTVSDYGYNLGLLFQFLDQRQITDIQSVTPATLADFQRWIYYQPTKQGTPRGVVNQNGILAAVKSLCRFLKIEGYLATQSRRGHRVCPPAAQPAPERPHAPGGQAHH